MNVLLSPHNDDETLFAAYTILEYSPHVVVCFRSDVQERYGVSAAVREWETKQALTTLGCESWQQSPILDTHPDPSGELLELLGTVDAEQQPQRVWAPMIEEGGHEQHNLLGVLAFEVFGNKVSPYCTYRRGSMRTRRREVPASAEFVALKMHALACYQSQIGLENTQAWFLDDTLREYVP